MVKFKIIIILVLLFLLSVSFAYYLNHVSDKLVYRYHDYLNPIIIKLKDEVKLNNNLKDEFKIFSRSEFNIFEKTNIDTDKDGKYNYGILVKNKAGESYEEIKVKVKNKVIIKEIIKEVPSYRKIDNQKPIIVNNINQYHDISIKQYATTDELVALLTDDLILDNQVTIDYGQVNLTIKGRYKAYFIEKDGTTKEVSVDVI